VKGEARRQRLLLRFRIPPFTSSNDLDAFIAQFVTPMNIAAYREAVQQCGAALTKKQRQSALSGLSTRQAVYTFITSEAYLHPIPRTLGALALFLAKPIVTAMECLGSCKISLGAEPGYSRSKKEIRFRF
jgi:hypothetical protein